MLVKSMAYLVWFKKTIEDICWIKNSWSFWGLWTDVCSIFILWHWSNNLWFLVCDRYFKVDLLFCFFSWFKCYCLIFCLKLVKPNFAWFLSDILSFFIKGCPPILTLRLLVRKYSYWSLNYWCLAPNIFPFVFVSEANLHLAPVSPSVRPSVGHKILSGQLLLNGWMDWAEIFRKFSFRCLVVHVTKIFTVSP